ncbi:MAG: dicarboxylate/amino acid:cation symporter [Deltaproteobacteria bacterium]|nr:dicarboxylate/amino acid:cation symporter [Deltaproteobacteria bacterium]MCW5805113.1 dicarboxylate/amino acid:cation symporter [Deltaproteobacteria bacterium]
MHLPKLPLFARVLIGVVLGAAVGIACGRGDVVPGITTADLGAIGLLVVRVLKMLAVPLVLFAVLDAVARTEVTGRMGLRLVVICLINVSVAFAIGLTLMNVLEPGAAWQGRVSELTGHDLAGPKRPPADATLSPLSNLDKLVPESAVQPFSENNVVTVVLFALFVGAAIRRLRRSEEARPAMDAVVLFVEGAYRLVMQMLAWVIEVVPIAVFGVVAQVVGKAGLDAFAALWGFLGVILLGMALHAFVYYPLAAWWVGRVSPRVYLGRGATAIVTGVSTNSSLATMPVTLRTLEGMGVSTEAARMSACVGTNLNNDGITLYEAMAALFLCQALGYDLTLVDQLTIVAASLMAGVGVAGIPEAGMVVLPLVLAAAGLPEAAVGALLPIVFTVDWILARCRTVVNVMADMLVAILLDRWAARDRDRDRHRQQRS